MGHLNSFSWCLKTLIKHTPPSLKLVLTETLIRPEIIQVLMIQSSQPNSVTVGAIYAPLPVWQDPLGFDQKAAMLRCFEDTL